MKKVVLFVTIVLSMGQVLASPIDSLQLGLDYQTDVEKSLNTLYTLAYQNSIEEDTMVDRWLEEGIALATAEDESIWLGIFHNLLGYRHHYFNRFNQAYLHFSFAEAAYSAGGDSFKASEVSLYLARYELEAGQHAKAEARFRKCLSVFSLAGDYVAIGRTHNNLGYHFRELGDLDKVVEECSLAHANYRKGGNVDLLIKSSYELAATHLRLSNLQEAEVYLQKALPLLPQSQDSTLHATRIYFLLGEVAAQRGEQAAAAAYFSEALASSLEHFPAQEDTYYRSNTAAAYYLAWGQVAAALSVLKAQNEYITDTPDEEALRTLTLLAEAYAAQGNHAEAYAINQQYRAGVVAATTAQAEALRARQEAEVLLAQQDLEHQQQTEAYNRYVRYWWLALAGIVLLCALGVWGMYRLKEKYRKRAEQNATHWPELNRRIAEFEDVLSMLG